MKTLRPGMTFTHKSMLDPGWKPSQGQRYADGPKATMEVTRVTSTTVYFGYTGSGHGGFSADRTVFEQNYLT